MTNRDQAKNGPGRREPRAQDTKDKLRVPVVEEQLRVEKDRAEFGEVELRKRVVEEQQTVPVELRRDQVHMERHEVRERPARPGEIANAFDEGTIRVPVRGETATVTKEAVVTGEVVLRRDQTTEHQELTDTVRKSRVEVEERAREA